MEMFKERRFGSTSCRSRLMRLKPRFENLRGCERSTASSPHLLSGPPHKLQGRRCKSTHSASQRLIWHFILLSQASWSPSLRSLRLTDSAGPGPGSVTAAGHSDREVDLETLPLRCSAHVRPFRSAPGGVRGDGGGGDGLSSPARQGSHVPEGFLLI